MVTSDFIARAKADAVILAIGASPCQLAIPGINTAIQFSGRL
jgi:hypothetical protein